MTSGRVTRAYSALTPEQRAATRFVREDIVDVAWQHRHQLGWHSWETDPIASAARALGVYLWPAFVSSIRREVLAP